MLRLAVLVFALIACGGAAGPAGPAGPPGAAGSGDSIVSGVFCSRVDTWLFQYETWRYASGDRLVRCTVAGAGTQTSTTRAFKKGSAGAETTGICDVLWDVDASTSGFFRMTLANSPSVASSVYLDPGSASDGHVTAFGAADCQTL